MQKVISVAMCAVMLFGMVTIGYAERVDWRGGTRMRIDSARVRIQRGIERGSLTRPEAASLHRDLDRILNKIDRMKDDGSFSPNERAIINRDLDILDKRIMIENTDPEFRPRIR